MSAKYPIVAMTGAVKSGAVGVRQALERIFYRENVKAALVEGSSFRRYEREAMREAVREAQAAGHRLGHFGPEGNVLDKLEQLFADYATTGTGECRRYVPAEGKFTPWERLPENTDLLLYRGMHGAARTDSINIAQYPDLSIGIAPNANLEWMTKIQHDVKRNGMSPEAVQASILNQLHDYVHYITPQFMRTHINFQLIPLVDTSDPFGEEITPSPDECALIIHFVDKFWPDFIPLLTDIPGAFMSRRNTMVVPSSKTLMAIELILMPIIHQLVENSRPLRGVVAA
jgi:phosphoribulokinase